MPWCAVPGPGVRSLALVLSSATVSTAIHHTAVIVRDLDTSLRFYRDGIGLDVLADRQVEGDWPGLFDAPSRRLRAVFLGDAGVPDDHAGVLELNVLDGDIPAGPPVSPPRTGFFMVSFFVDVEATLSRLGGLQKRRAEPVEFVGATASGEQLNPDLRLEQGDRPAYCRLRHREMLGGFSKGADLGNRLEIPQLI